MAAANTDKFMEVGSPGTATTLSSPGYTSGVSTSINVASTTNWPTTTGVVFAMDEVTTVNGEEVRVDGTYNEFVGTVASATQITNVDYVGGDAERSFSAGSTTRVYIPVSAERENRLVEGVLVHANQDGTLKNNAVATATVQDDAITDAKLDYPRWYQEIARTTLGSAADTITVSSIPARKYLKIIITTFDTGGTNSILLRFNNDSGSNYARRLSTNGGADSTSTSASEAVNIGAGAANFYCEFTVTNIATREKQVQGFNTTNGASGAATAPDRAERVGKWANTADQITRIDVINGGTGDYAAGSEVIVLGHD